MELEELAEHRADLIDKAYLRLPQTKEAFEVINVTRRRRRSEGSYCSIIYGPSGTGKSTILKKYLEAQSLRPDGSSPVFLVRTPTPFSQGAWAEVMLRELNLPTVKQSLALTFERIADGLVRNGVELLLLDEISHVVDHKKADASIPYWVTDTIKLHFLDNAKIPVVMTGVPVAMALFEMNPQLKSRRHRAYALKPYDIDEDKDRERMTLLLEIMEDKAGLETSFFSNNEGMVRRMHVATDGVHMQIVSLMKHAVSIMTRRGLPALDQDILAVACAELADPGSNWINPFLVPLSDLAHAKAAAPDETRITRLHKRTPRK
jgi:hypothetical protein